MEARQEAGPKLPAPFFYYRANQDGSVEWGEDCVCQDSVYNDEEESYHSGRVYSEAQVLALLAGHADLVAAGETGLQYIEAVCCNTDNPKKRKHYADAASKLRAALAKTSGAA